MNIVLVQTVNLIIIGNKFLDNIFCSISDQIHLDQRDNIK